MQRKNLVMLRTSCPPLSPIPSEEPPRFSNETAFAVLSQGVALGRHSEEQIAVGYVRGGLPPRAMRRVHDYIVAHLEQKISNDALAEVAELCTCHFARAFKQSEGVSPHRYVLQCGVRRAQELLLAPKCRCRKLPLPSASPTGVTAPAAFDCRRHPRSVQVVNAIGAAGYDGNARSTSTRAKSRYDRSAI
jgi:AraC-like DNA-binding protein